MIQKHQIKLGELRNSGHGKGLEKAYQNSVDLEEKFRTKHNINQNENMALTDSIIIKAKIASNGNTTIEIGMKFVSSNYTNTTIAQEIRNRFLALDTANITNLIKVENTSAEEKLTDLEARANVKNNTSRVEVEYKFWLNETNKTRIIEGIYNNLTSGTNGFLKVDYILQHLEMKSLEDTRITPLQTGIRNEKHEKENKPANKAKGKNDKED
jgi:acyl-CoA hydrolase